ncbi:MAG: hypothetical protein WDA23_09740 [Gemmobacter sp.]
MLGVLGWIAGQGRLLLVAGLAAGIVLPGLARAMEPMILPLIVVLLFLSALRIDPLAALPRGRGWPRALGLVLLMQTGFPLVAVVLLWAAGWLSAPLAVGVVLALSGPPLTGSPGIAILTGAPPAPALRQMVLGTALLPLTVLPVFWLMPVFGDTGDVLAGTGRLLAIVLVAGGGGIVVRRMVPRWQAPGPQRAVEGLIALAMGLVVIGLMSAVGPALMAASPVFWLTLAAAFAISFGVQVAVALFFRCRDPEAAPALGIVAGNRNVALFLGALPAETAAVLLLFIGCYQVPMYLTPFVMVRFYRWVGRG